MADFKELSELLGELDEDGVLDIVKTVSSEEDAAAAIEACQAGMAIVGELFEKGEYFVGDLIFSGEILTSAMDILKEVSNTRDQAKLGKVVIATVHGDLHDIGKNIFKNMIDIAGFEVHDLGIDQTPEAFVEKIKEVKPDIVGMSGVLTLALDSMKDTVDAIKEAGLRDSVKIIIGGNPVTAEACEQIGADAFTTNASEGQRICLDWVQ